MSWGSGNREAAARFADRRKAEDAAPRLGTTVPTLETLRLEVNERRAGHSIGEAPHIRHIVVEHAPALFILQCRDPSCKDGGHDITHLVTRSLREHKLRFEGEDVCCGSVGSTSCQRVLHFVAVATYRA